MYNYIQKLKNNGCFVANHAHLGCCFLLMVMLLIFLEVTTKLHLEQSWDRCQWVFLWKGFERVASNIVICFSFSFSFEEWTLPKSNLIKITFLSLDFKAIFQVCRKWVVLKEKLWMKFQVNLWNGCTQSWKNKALFVHAHDFWW